MKIVSHVDRPHDCHAKLRAFAEAQEIPIWFGSIAECDCGKQYKLVDSQRDGPYWKWYHPDSGDMSKR